MFDENIFKDKKIADLFTDIYENHTNKKGQINELLQELMPLIQSANDATMLTPLIQDYLELSLKNDEMLVKLTNTIQKFTQTNDKNSFENDLDSIMDEIREDVENEQVKSIHN